MQTKAKRTTKKTGEEMLAEAEREMDLIMQELRANLGRLQTQIDHDALTGRRFSTPYA